jgi:twitching motility protein PilT
MDAQVELLLQAASERGGSDLLFAPGAPPTARVHGKLVRLGGTPLTADASAALARALAGPRWDELLARRQVDFSFSYGEVARVRANLFFQRGTLAGALRFIPYEIPTLAELGAPAVCNELVGRPNGLVLMTGPTGSGKSTTLAAMIDMINRERDVHVITIEDPIEYVHRHQRSIVVQREVGSDTPDFAGALRAALRESPDVVLVGETGHLVFATLHTNDTAQAVDRIVDVFPSQQQRQIQAQLSQTLAAILHQRLLPRADGSGRVAVFEVMLGTPAIRNLIRDGKASQLRNVLATGAAHGMRTLEADLRRLQKAGIISRQAVSPSRSICRDDGPTDQRRAPSAMRGRCGRLKRVHPPRSGSVDQEQPRLRPATRGPSRSSCTSLRVVWRRKARAARCRCPWAAPRTCRWPRPAPSPR